MTHCMHVYAQGHIWKLSMWTATSALQLWQYDAIPVMPTLELNVDLASNICVAQGWAL